MEIGQPFLIVSPPFRAANGEGAGRRIVAGGWWKCRYLTLPEGSPGRPGKAEAGNPQRGRVQGWTGGPRAPGPGLAPCSTRTGAPEAPRRPLDRVTSSFGEAGPPVRAVRLFRRGSGPGHRAPIPMISRLPLGNIRLM